MNYEQTLKYLYDALPMFQKIGGAAFNKGLDKTNKLLEALDSPNHKFKSVHIAGTNGKGSVSSMLSAILQSAGYKTGLYTSPHLKNFTERIRVNGAEIPKENVVSFVRKCQPIIEQVKPSFFELTVAMAFDHFASQNVDVAFIEVGMGGRLDSTNVITPLLSIITNISLDHQQFLGETLEKIAGEKAGIIKPGIPVLISEYIRETRAVFEHTALEKNSEIYFAEDLVSIHESKRFSNSYLTIDCITNKIEINELECQLSGKYQLKNLKAVIAATEILGASFSIPEKAIREGIKNVSQLSGLKGRWQTLSHKPLIICDTGHNEAGITCIINQLRQIKYHRLHFVFGVVKDKDVNKILTLLPESALYYFCEPSVPRAMPVEELYDKAKQFGLKGKIFKNVNEALESARQSSSEEDLIFIGGSTFVVADLNDL